MNKNESIEPERPAVSGAVTGSPKPLPECLDGIYSSRGGWEAYSPEVGYRKKPCDIRTRDGRESGPYWPNAGKFCPLDKSGTETHEREVVAVCYYGSAEDSENVKLTDSAVKPRQTL